MYPSVHVRRYSTTDSFMQCSLGQMPPFVRERELFPRTTSTTTHPLYALLTFVAAMRRETYFLRLSPFDQSSAEQSLSYCLAEGRMVQRVSAPSSCSRLLAAALFLFAAAGFGPNAAVDAVLLDFEGLGNDQQVGSFYGPGGAGPSDYGIFFGTTVVGAIDSNVAGGTYSIANVPSPNTALYMKGPATQAFVTVSEGFTALSFQYTSVADVHVLAFTGPNLTGAVVGTALLPGVGRCQLELPACGGSADYFGVWKNATVPFPGWVAMSAGFSTDTTLLFVDDMVIELAIPTKAPTNAPTLAPTKAPTKGPTKVPTTKRPTRFPTKSPTTNACLRMGRKGNNRRCMRKKANAL
jgi:hypothetical protein